MNDQTTDNLYNNTYFVERAVKEEQHRHATRAWSVLLLVISGGYFFGLFVSLTLFSKIVHSLPFIEMSWFVNWVVTVPTAIVGALGFMGWLMSKDADVLNPYLPEHEKNIGSPNVWSNLPQFGRVLMVIFGSALVLGLVGLILRILYRVFV